MAFHKSLCALLAAATLSYSTPALGNTPAPSCEERVAGAVRIERTDACTDRFGIIYAANGVKVQDPKILLQIQSFSEYKEAKEGANALYLQMEAVRQRETSSGLEEQIKKEQLRKKENAPPPYLQSTPQPAAAPEPAQDLPPPYLQPGYQENSPSLPPSSSSPSWQSPAAEQSANDKTNNILAATLFGAGGMGLIGLGFKVAVDNKPCENSTYNGISYNECEKPDNSLTYVLLISGVVSLGVSIYFLAR